MGVHEFYTTVEQNDIIGLVDALASKAGTPYRGVVPSGSTTPNIAHNLGTTDVDVTVIRTNDHTQVGVPALTVDANNVELTFTTAPTGGQYRVIVSAGTGTGGGGGGGGEGGTPDPHAASHASDGTDPVSPASIGAAGASHNHAADYAPLTHASRHFTAGADPLTPANIGAATAVHSHSGTDVTSGTVAFARLPTGTTGSTVSVGSHTHSGIGAHATTHALGGSDPLTPDDIGASPTTHDHSGRIIPSGGTTGQALVKTSDDDYDVEWGAVDGGVIDTPTYGPTVVKPLPPVNVTPTAFYWVDSTYGNGMANLATINASLGTHFRVNYTPGTGGQVITTYPSLSSILGWGMSVRITNPTDGQTIMIEYRNQSAAVAQDMTGIFFEERNFQGGTYGSPGSTLNIRSGFTAGPTANTRWDLGGMMRESVLWQSTCYYGLIYDARARSNAGAWRLLSQVPGYSV